MSLSDWFWEEEFWLPAGLKWSDFKSTPGSQRPNLVDLRWVFPLAILQFAARHIFERFIALPFCKSLGIKDVTPRLPEPNSICEKAYKVSQSPSAERIEGLSKQLGWSLSRVRRWFRRKRTVGKPKLLRKATETCWRLVIYLSFVIHEAVVLFQTDWLYDSNEWFRGFIKHQLLTDGTRWLFLFQLSVYLCLMVSQFMDIKRKDFWQMSIHHVVTFFLVGFAYVLGIIRIGPIIMAVHDVSDMWLEAAKIANYAKWQKTCDVLFIIFAAVFYISRLVVYPFWVLHAALFKSHAIVGWYRSYYYLMGSLCLLQVLHIIWGFSIARVIYQFAIVGKVERDVRSEDEESTEDDAKKKDH